MGKFDTLPYIGDRTKDLKGEDFFELIQYAHMKNMCMRPGCTTCGCMPFREFCRYTIGRENMVAMIEAVTKEDMINHSSSEWYDALRIICVVFHDLPVNNYLMQTYFSIRDMIIASRERAYEEDLLRKKRIKEEKAAQRAVISKAHIDRATEKNQKLTVFIRAMTEGKKNDVPDEEGNVRKVKVMTPFGKIRMTLGQKTEYIKNRNAIDEEIEHCLKEHS